MYMPAHFAETRPPVLHALIDAHPLATVVAVGPSGLIANHVPLELDPGAGELGCLRGHIARGNPLWKQRDPAVDALAVFQGPQAYISPRHYASKAEHGKVVPTWNYAVVHAHGPLRVVEDAAWLRTLIERLTERHEAAEHAPRGEAAWRVGDAPADFIDGLVKAIVGIEIPIARLEGKWKVSQNRSAADREGVAAGLSTGDDPMRHAMAALVRGA